MQAITYQRYGPPDVLELREVDAPAVGDDQVLVRVHAAGVNPADWHYLLGTPYLVRLIAGLRRPKRQILGFDMAGRVEAVGREVTRFRPGDDVFGEVGGAYAEFVACREDRLVIKPAGVSYEQAAAVPVAALTALQGLRDRGRIEAGHHVLINGASGGVGTFAVQIAKTFGATVTAVCSARNVELVRTLGADTVLDYTQTDFTAGDDRFDLILDAVGNHPLRACRRVMNADATYVAVGATTGDWIGPLTHLLRVRLASFGGNGRMVSMLAKSTPADLHVLAELLESGAVTAVIDRVVPLADAAEALRHQGEGHAQGKTVISVAPSVATGATTDGSA